jgi:hypothetical protein
MTAIRARGVGKMSKESGAIANFCELSQKTQSSSGGGTFSG